MQNLTIAQVIEKNKLASSVAYIILLEIDVKASKTGPVVETLHVTNNTEQVTYKGNTYTPYGFEIELKSEIGEAPSVDLSIFDVTGAIRQRVTDYKGGTGFEVRVMVVSASNLASEPEILEHYSVTNTTFQDYGISIALGTENYLNITFPPRQARRLTCSFVFGGPRCKKVPGAGETCSRLLNGDNGCRSKNNTKNFGGFASV